MALLMILILLIASDQIAKYLAVQYLLPIDTLPLVQDVLHLTYAENTGAAFSMLSGNQTLLIGVTSVTLVIMAVILFVIRKKPNELLMQFAMIMILGGGIGNLIDRVRLHYVVDFIDFRLINFAIFNLADTWVNIGTALLFYVILFNKTKVI